MRKNEIEIGGEYAIQETYGSVRRVRVLETGVARETAGDGSYWSRSRSTVNDGVRVQYLDRETGEDSISRRSRRIEPTEEAKKIAAGIGSKLEAKYEETFEPARGIVMSRDVKHTWATQERNDQARADSKRKAEAHNARQVEKLAAVNRALENRGHNEVRWDSNRTYDGRYTTSNSVVTVSLDTLVQLLGVEVDA